MFLYKISPKTPCSIITKRKETSSSVLKYESSCLIVKRLGESLFRQQLVFSLFRATLNTPRLLAALREILPQISILEYGIIDNSSTYFQVNCFSFVFICLCSFSRRKISTSSWTAASPLRKVKPPTAFIVKLQIVRDGVCTRTMSILSIVQCVINRTVWRAKWFTPTWTAKNIKMTSREGHIMMKRPGKRNSFSR